MLALVSLLVLLLLLVPPKPPCGDMSGGFGGSGVRGLLVFCHCMKFHHLGALCASSQFPFPYNTCLVPQEYSLARVAVFLKAGLPPVRVFLTFVSSNLEGDTGMLEQKTHV